MLHTPMFCMFEQKKRIHNDCKEDDPFFRPETEYQMKAFI